MKNLENVEDKRYTFGIVLLIANRMDTLLDRDLKEFDITGKQWLLSVVVESLFDEPPTIKQISSIMGSSHQNIKQLALKLEQKGLVVLEKDPKDGRATRIKLKEDRSEFWADIAPKGTSFIGEIFKGINTNDLAKAREVMEKISSNLLDMEGERQ